jgi:hypothetical protein
MGIIGADIAHLTRKLVDAERERRWIKAEGIGGLGASFLNGSSAPLRPLIKAGTCQIGMQIAWDLISKLLFCFVLFYVNCA